MATLKASGDDRRSDCPVLMRCLPARRDVSAIDVTLARWHGPEGNQDASYLTTLPLPVFLA